MVGADAPKYELGHLDRVRRIRSALAPGIFVVGNAFDGVSVSDLARAAAETTARVTDREAVPRKEPMSDTIYASYPVLQRARSSGASCSRQRARLRRRQIGVFKDWAGRVDVRGSYSTVGFERTPT